MLRLSSARPAALLSGPGANRWQDKQAETQPTDSADRLAAAALSQSAGAQMAQESWKGKSDCLPRIISCTVCCFSVANYGFWVRVYIFLITWPEPCQWLRSWESHEKCFTAFDFLRCDFRLRLGLFDTDRAAKQCNKIKVALRQLIFIHVKNNHVKVESDNNS